MSPRSLRAAEPTVSPTKVGHAMRRMTGVRTIMKDIEAAMAQVGRAPMVNLSAGNPVILPEVRDMWRRHTQQLVDGDLFGPVVCRYGATRGYEPFVEAVVDCFNRQSGWDIGPANVLVTPGSQQLYFMLANLFCGETTDGDSRRLVFPLVPDYAGYEGVLLDPTALSGHKPLIEKRGEHRFKYRVDLASLEIGDDVGALLLSRPCNPTGNILTDDETMALANMAAAAKVPLICDTAYGPPFPNLAFADMSLCRGATTVHCFSLSKAGLPGDRIGFVIANEEIITRLECFLANLALHAPRFGQAIAAEAIRSGELSDLSNRVIRPFYLRKKALFEQALDSLMPAVPWRLHVAEGSLFAWLWFEDLPVTDLDLYQSLKERRVFVVPGSYFFPGVEADWPHRNQCLRVSLTAADADIDTGIAALAEVVGRAYGV
jgi:valine--pyruvate aminotransferase